MLCHQLKRSFFTLFASSNRLLAIELWTWYYMHQILPYRGLKKNHQFNYNSVIIVGFEWHSV